MNATAQQILRAAECRIVAGVRMKRPRTASLRRPSRSAHKCGGRMRARGVHEEGGQQEAQPPASVQCEAEGGPIDHAVAPAHHGEEAAAAAGRDVHHSRDQYKCLGTTEAGDNGDAGIGEERLDRGDEKVTNGKCGRGEGTTEGDTTTTVLPTPSRTGRAGRRRRHGICTIARCCAHGGKCEEAKAPGGVDSSGDDWNLMPALEAPSDSDDDGSAFRPGYGRQHQTVGSEDEGEGMLSGPPRPFLGHPAPPSDVTSGIMQNAASKGCGIRQRPTHTDVHEVEVRGPGRRGRHYYCSTVDWPQQDDQWRTEPHSRSRAQGADRRFRQFGHCRIGEAANPGPGQGGTRRGSFEYPEPHRPGFRDILTPGFENEERAHVGHRGEAEPFQLQVETTNTTGWSALRKRLLRTKSHILLAQETRLGPEQLDTASQWALGKGWKMVPAPAVLGPNGGNSAGVAIFARSWIGLRHPPKGDYIIHPARAVAAIADIPNCRPLVLVSTYLWHGQGMSNDNRGILAKIGAFVQSLGGKWQAIVGGDFNNEPDKVAAAGVHEELGAMIVHPSSSRGTCRTATTARTYDFFMITAAMTKAIQHVQTQEVTGVKTHTPVTVQFKPRMTALKHLAIVKPEPLLKQRVYGPLLPPPSWARARCKAEIAVLQARGAKQEEAQRALDEAYREFATTAELELLHTTGTATPRQLGTRAEGPKVQWRSIVPETQPEQGQPLTATMSWLAEVAREVKRLATPWTSHQPGDEETATSDDAHPRPTPHLTSTSTTSNRGGARRQFNTDGGGAQREEAEDESDDWHLHQQLTPCEVLEQVQMALITDFPTDVDHPEILRLHGRLMEAADQAKQQLEERRGPSDALREEIVSLLEEATTKTRQWQAQDEAETIRKWKNWLKDGVTSGAKHAHQYLRLPGPGNLRPQRSRRARRTTR